MTSTTIRKPAGGRPPKFTESRRPVTVTLPDRILRSLAEVSRDRAKAIVKCVEAVAGAGVSGDRAVELVEVLPGKAIIVVKAGRELFEKIDWLRLVEIAPARHILVLPAGVPVERLEVELRDLIDGLPATATAERSVLERCWSILVAQRRKKSIYKAEFMLVDV